MPILSFPLMFSLNSMRAWLLFEPTNSCARAQDDPTELTGHQFTPQWFIKFPEFAEFTEFLFHLGKTRFAIVLVFICLHRTSIHNIIYCFPINPDGNVRNYFQQFIIYDIRNTFMNGSVLWLWKKWRCKLYVSDTLIEFNWCSIVRCSLSINFEFLYLLIYRN